MLDYFKALVVKRFHFRHLDVSENMNMPTKAVYQSLQILLNKNNKIIESSNVTKAYVVHLAECNP